MLIVFGAVSAIISGLRATHIFYFFARVPMLYAYH